MERQMPTLGRKREAGNAERTRLLRANCAYGERSRDIVTLDRISFSDALSRRAFRFAGDNRTRCRR